jgi:restriction system protein
MKESQETTQRRSREDHLRHQVAALKNAQHAPINPTDFELYVGTMFEGMGCHVLHTGKSNDGGVDLVVIQNGKRGLVQCKRYLNPIGPSVVRDLRGAVVREGAHFGFLVTTATFTKAAEDEAMHQPRVYLVDGVRLQNLRQKYCVNNLQVQVNKG